MKIVQKLKVQRRNGFSDRNKIKLENTTLQFDDFDERTRTALINVSNAVVAICNERNEFNDQRPQIIMKGILADIYCQEINWESDYNEKTVLNYFRQTIREDSYDDILTAIEHFVYLYSNNYHNDEFYSYYNNVFEKEYVGYRFVNKQITKITDDMEIQEIEHVNEVKVDAVKEHINKSLAYLSNREKPDYENSIKESISAVEAMCSSIVGKSDSLGKTLNKLQENGVVIHGALKTAFSQLYGWTSDANGIRHAGDIGGASSTFDEAKFMLVSCCAFINYLKSSLKD